MARYKIIGLTSIAVLLLTIIAATIFFKNKKEVEVIDFTIKELRFVFEVANKSGNYMDEASFKFSLPMDILNRQELIGIESNQDYSIVKVDSGQQYADFNLKGLPPGGRRMVKVDLQVKIAMQAVKGNFEEYHLSPEKYIEFNDPLIQSVVKRFDEGELYPFSIYEWVNRNIKSDEYRVNSKGALHALRARSGDCTEHMYVYMALARAGSYPARGVSGFVVANAVESLSASQYHNWAEYYDGQYWRLVDTQEAVFNDKYEQYIVFGILGEAGADDTWSGFVTTDSDISIKL